MEMIVELFQQILEVKLREEKTKEKFGINLYSLMIRLIVLFLQSPQLISMKSGQIVQHLLPMNEKILLIHIMRLKVKKMN